MRDQALELLKTKGQVETPGECGDKRYSGQMIYVVVNGGNVLQIGKGSAQRMKKVMRGSLAGKHNKAFICALAEVVFECPNEYFYVCVKDKTEASELESWLHSKMGIQTNKSVATWITDESMISVEDVHRWLCSKARETPRYKELDPIEQQMLEELFDLITYGTSVIKRRSGVVRSCQGDNLEGNILMRLQKRYLINIFQKFTDNYFRYGSHVLSNDEFEEAKKGYSYSPKRKPFLVCGD